VLLSLYTKIINAGVKKALNDAIGVKAKYLNFCLFYGFLVQIPYVVFKFYIGLNISIIANISYQLVLVFCYLINCSGKYLVSRTIALIGVIQRELTLFLYPY
jgi:hypothetical protein